MGVITLKIVKLMSKTPGAFSMFGALSKSANTKTTKILKTTKTIKTTV